LAWFVESLRECDRERNVLERTTKTVSICLRYHRVAMPAVHVRDLPEEVLAALKRRAARHERSLQRELRHLLCVVAQEEPSGEPVPPIELRLSDARPTSSWRREEIYGDDGR